MTQHVRKGYRNHRRATWAAVLGVLVAAALAVVLPALGATDGAPIEPTAQPSGVVPKTVNVGGSNFTCSTYVNGYGPNGSPSGMLMFKVSNVPNSSAPVTYTSTNTAGTSTPLPPGVTFTLTGVNGQSKGKLFSFSATGASVFHVGVNGGTDHAWYDYRPKGGVSGDGSSAGYLHATKKSDGSLYNASWTTFCYALTTTISGRVFLDNNGDGDYDSTGSPSDVGQGGWSVSLYNTSTSTQFGSSIPSAGDGTYTFTGVPIGSDYKVCVQPPADSGTWGQTSPLGSGPSADERTACSSESPATPAGHLIANLQSAESNRDFGVEQTVAASCSTSFAAPLIGTGTGIVEYRAQLTAPPGTTGCKDAIVMYSYLDASGTPYATIHPPATSTNTTDYWVVERLRWKVDGGGAQNPVDLEYDDSRPYGDNMSTMKMCTADPRTAGQLFQLAANPATVMPSGTNADGVSHTSCMIQSTDFPSGNTYNYEAYTVSIVDGLKTPVG